MVNDRAAEAYGRRRGGQCCCGGGRSLRGRRGVAPEVVVAQAGVAVGYGVIFVRSMVACCDVHNQAGKKDSCARDHEQKSHRKDPATRRA